MTKGRLQTENHRHAPLKRDFNKKYSLQILSLSVMTGADNQLITVRVRQVSADLGYINIDICPDIGKVSVGGR